MSRIRVAFFENRMQAEPARRRLAKAGIDAEIQKESGLAKLWFVSRQQIGVHLEVPARDAVRTRELLIEWSSDRGWSQSLIRCPECSSMRIEYPQFTEKSFLTNFAMGLLAEFRVLERQYYCEDCHCMWARPDAKPRRSRAHLAPDYFIQLSPQPNSREVSASQAKSLGPQRWNGWEVPNRKKRAAGDEPLPIFKLWRRILGITILLAGITPMPGAHLSLCIVDANAASPGSGPAADFEKAKEGNSQPRQPSANSQNPTYLRDVLPILMGKCARCHNSQSQVMQNWLDYRTASSRRWEIKRRVWDSWKGAYFKQPMPTANSPESEAITDDERKVIRNWVESGAACGVRPNFSGALSKTQRIELGKRLFSTVCAACHQPTGQGIQDRFPPLAGSDFLNSDKHRAIKVLVNGLQGEVTVNGRKFNNSMPRFPLSDDDIANALTYVYNSFGNSGKEVSAQEVNAARAEKEDINLTGQFQSAKIPEEKSPFE